MWLIGAKCSSKSGFLGVKWVYLGLKKNQASNQTRKAKWCKMQVLFLKTDKARGVKG